MAADSGELHSFVFADLAGFTALTEAHGDEHGAEVAAQFCAGVRELLPDYGAEEVKSIGDALLLHVARADQALHLAARLVNDSGARHRSLGVRVGVHTGTAVQREGDWFGSAVNVAARVAALAHAGEVLLTAQTREAAGDAIPDGEIRYRGRRDLKHVARPVALYALARERAATHRLPMDPVCRMAVDPQQAAAARVHRGVEYHFCSDGCVRAFDAAPGRYASRPSRRGELLISDDARESATRLLARAFARGRLTQEELEERTERVMRARSRADLAAATEGLPRGRRGRRGGWFFWRLFARRPRRRELR